MGSLLAVILGVPPTANPTTVNEILMRLGVPTYVQFTELRDTSENSLQSAPRPVLAVLAVLTGKKSVVLQRLQRKVETTGRTTTSAYFLKAGSPKLAGTSAVIHCIANSFDNFALSEGRLKQFIDDTKELSPEERGIFLSKCHDIVNLEEEIHQSHIMPDDSYDQSSSFKEMRGEMTNWLGTLIERTEEDTEEHSDDSALPQDGNATSNSADDVGHLPESFDPGRRRSSGSDDAMKFAFIAFVVHSNILFELDARHDQPICHGECPQEQLLEKSAEILQQYENFDPEEIRFMVMVLTLCGCQK